MSRAGSSRKSRETGPFGRRWDKAEAEAEGTGAASLLPPPLLCKFSSGPCFSLSTTTTTTTTRHPRIFINHRRQYSTRHTALFFCSLSLSGRTRRPRTRSHSPGISPRSPLLLFALLPPSLTSPSPISTAQPSFFARLDSRHARLNIPIQFLRLLDTYT